MIRIYFILILLWFTISFSRSVFSILKGIQELPQELILSPYEKRVGIFGVEYEKFNQLQASTSEESEILIIASPDMIERGLFYKSYYFLHPRKIEIELESKQESNFIYDYVLDLRQ